jgi:hypothetical protein
MYVLSSFVFGYLTARGLNRWGRIPAGPLVRFIVVIVALFAIIHVLYEFRAPWPNDYDYAFYREVMVGRHQAAARTGILAFLFGFAVYLLRSRVWESVRKARGAESPKEQPARTDLNRSRGMP